MKRHNLAVGLVLAVVAVLGVTSPAAAQQQVPFLGTLQGVVTVTPLAPPYLSVLVKAKGNATQLGLFVLAIPHTVDRTNLTATGCFHFVAANGDKLSARFTGKATPTATPNVIAIVENAMIIGGTGRFAGASGSFTCERLYDRAAGTTIGSFTGMISYPGP